MDQFRITLTRAEYLCLLRMMGYAIGQAIENQSGGLVEIFLEAANAVNRDNPGWEAHKRPVDIGVWRATAGEAVMQP
jgi:hypothetical protein